MERTVGWCEDARCRSTGRSVLVGTGFGAVGGGITGAVALLSPPGFTLGAAVVLGGTVGALVGAVLGAAAGGAGGCLAARLTHAGRDRAARTALAVPAGVLTGLTVLAVLTVDVPALGQALLAGGGAAALAWRAAPWCLRPRRGRS